MRIIEGCGDVASEGEAGYGWTGWWKPASYGEKDMGFGCPISGWISEGSGAGIILSVKLPQQSTGVQCIDEKKLCSKRFASQRR